MSSSASFHLVRLGFQRASKPSSPTATRSPIYSATALRSASHVKSLRFGVVRWRCDPRHTFLPVAAMDEDSMEIPSLFEEGDDISGGYSSYMLSSSEGEDSDTDLLLNPTGDVDLPTSRDHWETSDGALTVAAHRFATIHKGRRKKRKLLVPLPPPHGLVCMEKFYIVLTAFSFVAMASGVKSIDGLDGLAGGVAALAFVGMSIAVLPICPKLAIFGASMAGTCIGFLVHNRYKASVYMGGVGSLALGGALAAIAACTGMFIPLLISSGIFVLELLLVMVQVSIMMATRHMHGTRRFFRMAPLHRRLKLFGLKEPLVVASAYIISSILALCAGYVGLISA